MTVADVYNISEAYDAADKLGCCWPDGWLAALETVHEILLNYESLDEAKEILVGMITAAQRPPVES